MATQPVTARMRAASLPSLSVEVARTLDGIVVSLAGPCSGDDVELVERLLRDLVEGQGNRAVTVEVDGLERDQPIDEVLARVGALARDRGVEFALERGRKALI